MRYALTTALFTVLLCGCASAAPTTADTVRPQIIAYKECNLKNAFPMVTSSESAIDIARISAGLCQKELEEVRIGLLEENKGSPYRKAFADGYVGSLRERMGAIVAREVTKYRSK